MRIYEGGPIPFNKILWYAVEILGFDEDLVGPFTSVIRELDMVYMRWVNKEREAQSKAKSSAKSPSSSGRSRGPRRRR